jgi:diguanylate cyclase (GGDEF)-like protein
LYNTALIIITSLIYGATLWMIFRVLFYAQGERSNFFFLCLSAASVTLFAYLLELLSTNADEALVAAKVFYFGSTFIATFGLFFVADYCRVKLHLFVRVLLPLISALIAAVMWSTKETGLFYVSYWFNDVGLHYLAYQPGVIFYPAHVFQGLITLAILIIIGRSIILEQGAMRHSLIQVLACFLLPVVFQIVYVAGTFVLAESAYLNFVPHAVVVADVLLYACILRFQIFDIAPVSALQALKSIREGYVLVDTNLNILSSNAAARRIIPGLENYPRGEDVRKVPGWPAELKNIVAVKEDDYVHYAGTENESERHYRATVNSVRGRRRTDNAYTILIQDVTDSILQIQQLQVEANTDPLTGVFNRRYFESVSPLLIEKSARQNEPWYIMMIDLDFFKEVNDRLGHQAGDAVLAGVAHNIRRLIRPYDLLARYGGEEFIVLFTEIDREAILATAERVRSFIQENTIPYNNSTISICCSIGIAAGTRTDAIDDVIGKADEALYTAKGSGRNRVCF